MTEIENDVFIFLELIKYGWHYQYSLYKNTNEDLKNVLSTIDFNDKKVLSVLASSDQLFSLYYLGAKTVDTFDKNKYTYYYFYLRKWCFMKYRMIEIPEDTRKILDALEVHNNTKKEKQAYLFWKKVLENCSNRNIDFSNNKNLFGIPDDGWSVPYTTDEKMLSIVASLKLNFKEYDIFKEIDETKKYDVVILSNILEFMSEEVEETTITNLNKLLKRNGFVLCSSVRKDDPIKINLFEKNGFKYESGASGIITTRKSLKLQQVSYTYKKVI